MVTKKNLKIDHFTLVKLKAKKKNLLLQTVLQEHGIEKLFLTKINGVVWKVSLN